MPEDLNLSLLKRLDSANLLALAHPVLLRMTILHAWDTAELIRLLSKAKTTSCLWPGSQAENLRVFLGTPRSIAARNISFSPRIQFHDTWPSGEYDRRGEVATCNRLTPMLAQQIKEELNTFKMVRDSLCVVILKCLTKAGNGSTRAIQSLHALLLTCQASPHGPVSSSVPPNCRPYPSSFAHPLLRNVHDTTRFQKINE